MEVEEINEKTVAKLQRNIIICNIINLFLLWLFPLVTIGWKIFIAIFLYLIFACGLLGLTYTLKNLKTTCLNIAIIPGHAKFDFSRWDKWIDLYKNRKTLNYY